MHSVSGLSFYADFSPVGGEFFDLNDLADFVIDSSTEEISGINFNNVFQRLILRNHSAADINIVNIAGVVNGQGGVLEMDAGLIALGAADGVTPGLTYTIPLDEKGNRPSRIGSVLVAGTHRYTQIPDFTNIKNDHRGLHFTYDSLTGEVAFGDGVNGKIPQGTIQSLNLFLEFNGNQLLLSQGKIVGAGGCAFLSPNLSPDFSITLNDGAYWSIVDCDSNVYLNGFVKHKWEKWDYLGVDASKDVRVGIAENSPADSLVFQTLNTSSAEVLTNINRPQWGVVEARYVVEKNTTYARTRLYNDGGDLTIRSFGGAQPCFAFRGGIDGVYRIYWSDGYKIGDTSPCMPVMGYFSGRFKLPELKFLGDVQWSGKRIAVLNISAGEWDIGSLDSVIDVPAGTLFSEIVRFGGESHGTLKRMTFRGVSDSGTRDINTYAEKGWVISNLETPNDLNVGNQAEAKTEIHFSQLIGHDFASGRGVDSSTTYTNAGKTEGAHWFKPHPDGPNASIISGVEDDIRYVGGDLYMAPGTVIETRSGVLSAYGRPTLFEVLGWRLENFDVTYKLWAIGSVEPSSFKQVSSANAQADYDAQLLSMASADSYVLIRAEKISGAINEGYIRNIKMSAPLDPNYVWSPPGAEIFVSAPLFPPESSVSGALLVNATTDKDLEFVSGLSGSEGYRSRSLVEGIDYSRGDTLELRAGWQFGLAASEKYVARFVAGENDLSAADGFSEHAFYPSLGIDGMDMRDYLSVIDGDVRINIDDVDGDGFFDPRGVPAWYYHLLTTREGLLNYFYVADLVSETEFVLNANVPLDNTGERQIKLKNPERDQVQPFWIRSADPYFDFIGHDHSGGRGISYNVGRVYSAPPIAPSAEDLVAAIINTSIPEAL